MPDGLPLRPDDPAELGGYRILGRLGDGSQGVVYLGLAPSGDHVAIKVLRARMAEDPGAHERFVRELSAAKKVARFCTAQVLAADIDDDRPYIVSEYVEGRSLRSCILREGPRTGGALERLAIGTLTALAAIHKAGIVHRDFTPHNVLLGPDGPRVIDFGIARALGAARHDEKNNVGTPSYMAPEQVKGREIGPPADMFAWGATILFAATGRPPFGNESVPAVMWRITESDPDVSALEEPLRTVVAACLAKDPAKRPTAQQAQAGLLGEEATGALMPPPAFGAAPPAPEPAEPAEPEAGPPPASPLPTGPETGTQAAPPVPPQPTGPVTGTPPAPTGPEAGTPPPPLPTGPVTHTPPAPTGPDAGRQAAPAAPPVALAPEGPVHDVGFHSPVTPAMAASAGGTSGRSAGNDSESPGAKTVVLWIGDDVKAKGPSGPSGSGAPKPGPGNGTAPEPAGDPERGDETSGGTAPAASAPRPPAGPPATRPPGLPPAAPTTRQSPAGGAGAGSPVPVAPAAGPPADRGPEGRTGIGSPVSVSPQAAPPAAPPTAPPTAVVAPAGPPVVAETVVDLFSAGSAAGAAPPADARALPSGPPSPQGPAGGSVLTPAPGSPVRAGGGLGGWPRRRVGWVALAGAAVVVIGAAVAVPLWPGGGDEASASKARAAADVPPAPAPTPTPAASTPRTRFNGIRSGVPSPTPKRSKPPGKGCRDYQHVYTMLGTGTVVLHVSVCRDVFAGTTALADAAPKDGWDVCVQLRGHVTGSATYMSTTPMTSRGGRVQSFKNGPKVKLGAKTKTTEDSVAVNAGKCRGTGAHVQTSWQTQDQLAAG